MMNSSFFLRLLATASFLGMLGVVFGAFGAHFLKSRLGTDDLELIRTGVFYLFIHAIVAILIAFLGMRAPDSKQLRGSGLFFLLGIVLFTGSLFLIATESLTGFPVAYIGIITPIGGLFFIIGWILLFLYALNKKN